MAPHDSLIIRATAVEICVIIIMVSKSESINLNYNLVNNNVANKPGCELGGEQLAVTRRRGRGGAGGW